MNIAFFDSSLTFIIHIKVRSSVEGRVKRATAMLNLEMETLKSELERTKLKVKEVQEVMMGQIFLLVLSFFNFDTNVCYLSAGCVCGHRCL